MARTYILEPKGLFDLTDPRVRPFTGRQVTKVQPFGCPRNGTMGHCYVQTVATPEYPKIEFIGLVLLSSLKRI